MIFVLQVFTVFSNAPIVLFDEYFGYIQIRFDLMSKLFHRKRQTLFIKAVKRILINMYEKRVSNNIKQQILQIRNKICLYIQLHQIHFYLMSNLTSYKHVLGLRTRF